MKTENRNKLLSNGALFITAMIWGAGFVAQSKGNESLTPLAFCAFRYILASLGMGLVLIIKKLAGKSAGANGDTAAVTANAGDCAVSEAREHRKNLLKGGVVTGCFMFVGTITQQAGMLYTSAGKTAFISAFYMALVPIIGIFLKRKCPARSWIAVIIGMAGLYLLSMGSGEFTLARGDVIIFIGAFFWAGQILAVETFGKTLGAIELSWAQYTVCALLSTIGMLIFDLGKFNLASVISCAWPLVYAGIFSTCIAFTMQIVGQKHASAAASALIMCLESVFGAIFGAVFLHEAMTSRELLGAGVMFVAILVSQMPLPSRRQ